MNQRTDTNANRRVKEPDPRPDAHKEAQRRLLAVAESLSKGVTIETIMDSNLASSLLSARFPRKLIKAAKARASKEGKTLKELIAEALEAYLKVPARVSK